MQSLNLLDENIRYLESDTTGHFWLCKNFEDQCIVAFGQSDDFLCFTKQCKTKQDAIDTAEDLTSRKVLEDNYTVKPKKQVKLADIPF